MKKTKTKTRKTKKTAALPLTDPRLVALLMFLDGDQPSGVTEYASALSAADRLLTSYPLDEAFMKRNDRPDIAGLITEAVHRHISNHEESDRICDLHATVMPDVVGASQMCGDHDPISGAFIDHKSLLWNYGEQGMLLGACLLYRLLTGGAR